MTEENSNLKFIKKNKTKNNSWEKNRRNRFNNTFEILAKLLPQYDPTKPFSKIEIIQRSILLIEDLRKECKKLLSEKNIEALDYQEKLEQAIGILRNRNHQLKEILRKAEIPVPDFNAKNSWVKDLILESKIDKVKLLAEINLEKQNKSKLDELNNKKIENNSNEKENQLVKTTISTNLTCNNALNNVVYVLPVKSPVATTLSTTFSTLRTPIMASSVFIPIKVEPVKRNIIKLKPKYKNIPGKIKINPLKKTNIKCKISNVKLKKSIATTKITETKNKNENNDKQLLENLPETVNLNKESLSPTAAYLMNFPIVSTRQNDDDGNNENQDENSEIPVCSESSTQNTQQPFYLDTTNSNVNDFKKPIQSTKNNVKDNNYLGEISQYYPQDVNNQKNNQLGSKSSIENNKSQINDSNFYTNIDKNNFKDLPNISNNLLMNTSGSYYNNSNNNNNNNNNTNNDHHINSNKENNKETNELYLDGNYQNYFTLNSDNMYNIDLPHVSSITKKSSGNDTLYPKAPLFTFSLTSNTNTLTTTNTSSSSVFDTIPFQSVNNSFGNNSKSIPTTSFTFSLTYPTTTNSTSNTNSKPTFPNFNLNNYSLPFDNTYNTNTQFSASSTQFTFSLTSNSSYNPKYSYSSMALTSTTSSSNVLNQNYQCTDINYYKNENKSIKSINKKSQNQIFPTKNSVKYSHVNWMTTPPIKQTSDFSILPPLDFMQNTVVTSSTPSSYYSSISNIDITKKSDIFFAHPPGDENFLWPSSKLPSMLDGNHFIPRPPSSALPNLHGDLALGNTTNNSSYENSSNNKNNNFLSVSQLVENQTTSHLNQNNQKSGKDLLKYSTSSSSSVSKSKLCDGNLKVWNSGNFIEEENNYLSIPPPIFPSHHSTSSNIPSYSNYKSGSHHIYSAEALIGNTPSKKERFCNENFIPTTDVSSYFPLDFNTTPTDTNNYNFFYNNSSYSMNELNNCNDNYSMKMDGSNIKYSKIKHQNQISTKLNNKNELYSSIPPPPPPPPVGVLPPVFSSYDNLNASSSYFTTGINSPMNTTDETFHLYPIPTTSSTVTSISNQPPYHNLHSTNSTSGTLTNFNLSTICPEINEKVGWG